MAGELYGDFSRVTFRPGSPTSGTLIQQGRVFLDADLNEQSALVLDGIRTLAADLIGPHGGPAPAAGGGFELTAGQTDGHLDLAIAPGRYYVGGIRCDAAGTPSYYHQPNAFFEPDGDDKLPDLCLAYLDVWERTVSALADSSFREVALGRNGPDTVARQRVVWRLRWLDSLDGVATVTDAIIDAGFADWAKKQQSDRGLLRARARRPQGTDDEPCITDPSAMFRGPENQLYRIEVHRGGAPGAADGPTFKWSRDNASAIYSLERLSGQEAVVASIGRGIGDRLGIGDWVEVVDDRSAVSGVAEPLRRVLDLDPTERRVVLSESSAETGEDPALHPFLRRWDQVIRKPMKDEDGAWGLPIVESGDGKTWVDLEDGVQVQFAAPPAGTSSRFRRGDYWLVPARVATGDVEWRTENDEPAAEPPFGVDHVYAPLALVEAGAITQSYRRQFAPLAI